MTVQDRSLEPHATLAELAQEIPGSVIVGDPNTEVRDVRHDAREVTAGDVFVARRGQHRDGRAFITDALARGAAAVIVEPGAPLEDVPHLVVPDAHRALAFASSTVWRHPSFSLEVIGVTGTNGKTTTTWLIEEALERSGSATGLLGTVEHRFRSHRWPAMHTTPEADDLARRMAAMRAAGAHNLAMEVSSHALALGRVEAVRFRVAAFTNLTQDHLDFHGSIDAYAAAKRRLFTDLGPAVSVLNIDDPCGARWAAEGVSGTLVTYSARGAARADFSVKRAELDARGIAATVSTPDGEVAMRSPLTGWHNLENVLCAAACAWAMEIPAQRGFEALSGALGAPGRLEPVRVQGLRGPAVFVDYAHTPDALANVLRALRPSAAGRLWCVFGCGGDRDPSKRAPMGRAVAEGADVAVVTTDNPRSEDPTTIAEMASAGLDAAGFARAPSVRGERGTYAVVIDRRAAIAEVIARADEDDVVLIAGKGHEPYQEVRGERRAFDDRVEARAALAERAGRA